MVKICPRCHKKNSDEALWCTNCKYRLVQHIGLEENIKKQEKSDPAVLKGSMPFFVRQDKKGRKKIGLIAVIIALILLIPTFYIIFTEGIRPREEVEFEKFIGTWVLKEDNTTILVFNKNGTCIFKNTNATFKIRQGSAGMDEPLELILEINKDDRKKAEIYSYKFNEEKNELTLSEVLTRTERKPSEVFIKTTK